MTTAKLTPFVRYALMILAGRLAAGGWMPPDVAAEIAYDPAVVEVATAGIVAIVTALWYLWSRSRKALIAMFDGDPST